jgi:hypothetical protein
MDESMEDGQFEKSLCDLLGIDIEKRALEIVNEDKLLKKNEIS